MPEKQVTNTIPAKGCHTLSCKCINTHIRDTTTLFPPFGQRTVTWPFLRHFQNSKLATHKYIYKNTLYIPKDRLIDGWD